jgi:hypothetical protein
VRTHSLCPIAHIGHWAWIELLVFAPAFAVLLLAAMRARRSPPHTKPQDRDAAPGVDRPSFEEE